VSSSFGPNERGCSAGSAASAGSAPSAGLRSDAWLGGEDEVALNHRAALRAAGLRSSGRSSGLRPLIGIACTASDLNRCDRGLTALAAAVRRGVKAAGGLPLEFPVMSLSEDLMKPTAMLYGNLLAIEVEETIRSQPLDGIVALGNCDKTVPRRCLSWSRSSAGRNLALRVAVKGDWRWRTRGFRPGPSACTSMTVRPGHGTI
jgi:dihydroxyacid dehydratase/phosphogluconate dehydratase